MCIIRDTYCVAFSAEYRLHAVAPSSAVLGGEEVGGSATAGSQGRIEQKHTGRQGGGEARKTAVAEETMILLDENEMPTERREGEQGMGAPYTRCF